MSDIQIFDKIIPQGYADQIEFDITSTPFTWHYINDVTNQSYGNNSGMVHLAYDLGANPSEWYPFLKPIVYAITEAAGHTIDQLLRIRVGYLSQTTKAGYEHNTPHIDFTMPHYTACYYVSDSDGDTVIFDQTLNDVEEQNITVNVLEDHVAKTNFTVAQRCSPKKGRVCIFDGLRFHASTKPAEHDRRLVITINYIAR
jgi:hypothetical protein